jgi:hypothetical protein
LLLIIEVLPFLTPADKVYGFREYAQRQNYKKLEVTLHLMTAMFPLGLPGEKSEDEMNFIVFFHGYNKF